MASHFLRGLKLRMHGFYLHFPIVFIALCLIKQKNNKIKIRFIITNYWHVTPCHLVQRLQRSRKKRFHRANLQGFIFQKSTIPRGLLVFPRFFRLNFAGQTRSLELNWKHSRHVEKCRTAGLVVQVTESEGSFWFWGWRRADDIQDQRRNSHSE